MAAPSASVSERTRSITPFKTIDRGRSLFSLISLSISPNSISALFWALVALRTLALMLGSWALGLGMECAHSFDGCRDRGGIRGAWDVDVDFQYFDEMRLMYQ